MSAEMWVNPHYLDEEMILVSAISRISRRKQGVIVDVGANIGIFSLRSWKLFPDCEIHAIEPHPKTFSFLQENVRINHADLDIYQLALGSTPKTVRVSNKHADDMNVILPENVLSGETSQMITLDELFGGNEIWILKIDVEGMEKDVLLGGQNVIKRTENVIIEVDKENYSRFGVEIDEVLEMLIAAGFKLVGIHSEQGRNLHFSYPLKLEGKKGENVFATKLSNSFIEELLGEFHLASEQK